MLYHGRQVEIASSLDFLWKQQARFQKHLGTESPFEQYLSFPGAPLVQADNADMMVKNMVMIMTRVSETDLVLHLLWIPNIIYRKELEEMSEMSDDDYKYVDGDGDEDGSQLLLLGKFEYGGGPNFKVVLEC